MILLTNSLSAQTFSAKNYFLIEKLNKNPMIQHAFIIAMIVLFIHACSWKGMIFEGIKKLIKPEGHIYKPIYGCPICMTPYYGTIMYLLFFRLSFVDWLLTIGTAAGMGVISVILIDIKDGICLSAKVEERNSEN
ncbi:hypothetical protein HDF19_05795 [Mucilaginibacter sp. E4BP6]|jgi:hypothetical protein|uniref:hypothetical protein n=1 Tax=Mucilaginibacter sp. E4BP6 TaxID=2723089 RepID=UPI003B00C840